jgi:hypothetical protein
VTAKNAKMQSLKENRVSSVRHSCRKFQQLSHRLKSLANLIFENKGIQSLSTPDRVGELRADSHK